MNEELPKATDWVAAWIIAHRDEIGGAEVKFVRQDEYGRTLCAEFDTPEHLIQFCAWDHASCLDILAFNRATKAEAYIVAGGCDGVVGVTQRLDAFMHWLNVNEPNRNSDAVTLNENKMTLSDVFRDLEHFSGEHTIYAARPWSPASPAIVAQEPAEGGLPEAASASGLAYFLEVSIAQDFFRDWPDAYSTAAAHAACSARLIHYAEHDA